MPLIVSEIENQYGEKIVDEEYYLENGKWYCEKINCYSSEALGLGSCQCVSHDPIDKFEVSRETILEIIQENPLLIKDLTEEEWRDLENYRKNKRYRLECVCKEIYNLEPEELKERLLEFKERFNLSEKELKKLLKEEMPKIVREYLEEELNLKNKSNKVMKQK